MLINPLRAEVRLACPAIAGRPAFNLLLVLDAQAMLAIEAAADESWLAIVDRLLGFEGVPRLSDLQLVLRATAQRHNPISEDEAVAISLHHIGEVSAAVADMVQGAMPSADDEGSAASSSGKRPFWRRAGIGISWPGSGWRRAARSMASGRARRGNGSG